MLGRRARRDTDLKAYPVACLQRILLSRTLRSLVGNQLYCSHAISCMQKRSSDAADGCSQEKFCILQIRLARDSISAETEAEMEALMCKRLQKSLMFIQQMQRLSGISHLQHTHAAIGCKICGWSEFLVYC